MSESPNILHAIWKNEALENHPLSESLGLFYSRLPTWRSGLEQISGYSIDQLLKKAASHTTVDWVVVHGEGSMYRSQDRILEVIDQFIATLPENTLIAGHLIDKAGFYCGIHEQFFIVNIELYEKLGWPHFGDYGHRQATLQNYVAGPSIHDNYTPMYLEKAEGKDTHKVWTCGWNIISVALENNCGVVNLSQSLRDEKTYIYPRDQTQRLLKNFEALYDIVPTNNLSQNRALAYLLLKKLGFNDYSWPRAMASFAPRKGSVFIYNTEPLVPNPQWIRECGGPLKGFIGTCAGFLDMANLKHFGFDETTKLIYYDINQDSISFKQYFLENFDGELEMLPKFVRSYKEKYPQAQVADNNEELGNGDLRNEFKSPEEFKQIFLRMQKLDRKFVHFNLLSEAKALVECGPGPNERTLLCISDIFTGTNEMTYGAHRLRDNFKAFLNDVSSRKKLIIQGSDYKDSPVLDYVPDLCLKYGNYDGN